LKTGYGIWCHTTFIFCFGLIITLSLHSKVDGQHGNVVFAGGAD